jgi:hypothetical protein
MVADTVTTVHKGANTGRFNDENAPVASETTIEISVAHFT